MIGWIDFAIEDMLHRSRAAYRNPQGTGSSSLWSIDRIVTLSVENADIRDVCDEKIGSGEFRDDMEPLLVEDLADNRE